MQLERTEKTTVLLAALSERYTSLHVIRGRVESTGVWIIGLSLGAGAWFLQRTDALSWGERGVMISGVFLALGALRMVYLADLHKGFLAQQRVSARIESELGLYTKGAFGSEEASIYPENWKQAGTQKSDGKFFRSTYLLLYLGAVFLIVSILASGSL